MAAAGVSYTVGREANSVYGETISGIQRALMRNHQLVLGIDPYVKEGDPSSGLLPGVEKDCPEPDGSGDRRVQAYCFRMCLTDDPENRIPFAKPDGYEERDYELLFRNLAIAPLDRNGMPWINSRMPNRKTDTNNRTGFSTDFIGGNWNYPEASYAERERIRAAHLKYQRGLMWTLANHPRVPEKIRKEVSKWGTCKDEFRDGLGAGWQKQLYVREARRMVGEYVMTEHECRGERVAQRPIAFGAYGMDSHNCRRYVDAQGFVRNEGNIEDYNVTSHSSASLRIQSTMVRLCRSVVNAKISLSQYASRHRTWRLVRSAWSRCSSRWGKSRARRRRSLQKKVCLSRMCRMPIFPPVFVRMDRSWNCLPPPTHDRRCYLWKTCRRMTGTDPKKIQTNIFRFENYLIKLYTIKMCNVLDVFLSKSELT